MADKNKLIKLVNQYYNNSSDNHCYSVNLQLETFLDSIDYNTYNLEWLEKITPEFQRDMKKWTKAMKLKFIENLLSGAKVELIFFKIENQRDIKIIDGHHVIVSILDFFHGRINPFGHKHIEFKNKLGFTQDYNLELKFYTFENWEEVGKFYIDMNENITHSKADIQKAKDWFLDKKNIIL